MENYCRLRLIFVEGMMNGGVVGEVDKGGVWEIEKGVWRGYGLGGMGYEEERKGEVR